jgi:hypothetical protein
LPYPHTSSAVSTTRRSLAACCSRVRALPSTVEEKPHWGERQSLLDGDVAARLLDAAYKIVLGFEVAALGRDEAEDDHLALGHEAQGSKVPERASSYSRRSRPRRAR